VNHDSIEIATDYGPGTTDQNVKTALLLIAHGSRQEEANADLHQVVSEVRRRGQYPIVEPAFLELSDPTIDAASRRCVEGGAARVILLPYFLSAGIHVRHDLEDHRSRLAAQYPLVRFHLAEPLGPDPALLDVLLLRARQVEEG
jgi:sirohydrochlorin ferrochelatase